jgi:hypothetical protein
MKKTVLLVVLLTLVAFVSGAIAGDMLDKGAGTTPPPPPPKFKGDIKSLDAVAKSVVVAKAKKEKTFVVTADTKITKGKDALKFEDLEAGMNVVIKYKEDGDKNSAVTINVSAPKAK